MQSLTSIFADNRLLALAAAIAAFLLFAVLVLLIVRLVFGNRLRMSGGRGRQQRLGVVDAFDMDRQRQLVLVRRDNTEHLVMIGGPNDLLIESTIIRAEMRDRSALSARDSAAAEPTRLPVPESWAPPTPMSPIPPTPVPAPSMPPPAVAPIAPVAMPPAPMAVPTPPPPRPQAPNAVEVEPAGPTPPPARPAPVETEVPADLAPRAPPKVDIFARLRGRGTPPAPPPPPAVEKPPVADADFFETEIAKALAPSSRPRPLDPPVVDAPIAATPPSGSEIETVPTPDIKPAPVPRPPFRPFTSRREPAMSGDGQPVGENAARPTVPRPAPPPFFTRPPIRPKDRASEPPPLDGAMETLPPVEALSAATPTAPIEAPHHEPAPPPPVPHEPPAKPSEAVDPFEEEMARLLGRAPGKDG